MEKMQSFREWLREQELYEAKQVGTIYHFTKRKSIYMLLDKNNQEQYGLDILEFFSLNGNFSTTRNSSLTADFSHPVLTVKNGYTVRLSFNGDKISHKFKIRPVLGLKDNSFDIFDKNDNRVPRKWGENEEVILGNEKNKDDSTFKLKDYLLQIDIYNKNQKESEDLKEMIEIKLNESNLKIPVNIVKKFVNIKDTNRVKLDETFGKLKEDELELQTCTYLEITKD